MKLSELTPYSFRNMSHKIKAQIAQEASRRLILYTDGNLVQRHLSVGSASISHPFSNYLPRPTRSTVR